MSIQIKDVSHIYSKGTPFETIAIQNINIDINKKEYIGIIGHTGSGKSTLIQHINGLIKPTGGNITVDGMNTKDKKTIIDIRKRVGLVFQYPEYQLFEETVEKDIGFGCKNMGMNEQEQEQSVKNALELVGLDYNEIAKRSPFELSGGQKRRVAIAGVIAMNPKTIILDEPTSSLDPKASKEILHMINRLYKNGINIVMVSHNMDEIFENATRAIVINEGEIFFDDTPINVFKNIDKLESIGLDLPFCLKFANQLKKNGFEIDRDITSNIDLINYIRDKVGEKSE